MVAENFQQVAVNVFFIGSNVCLSVKGLLQSGELFKMIEERVVEIIDDNFVVAPLSDHILLAAFDFGEKLFVVFRDSRVFLCEIQRIVLEQLEQECTIEAVAIAAQPSNVLVASSTVGLIDDQ